MGIINKLHSDEWLIIHLNRKDMKRRSFFRVLGGGIFIFIHPWNPFGITLPQTRQGRSLPTDFNAFLQIREDGTVSCYTGKVEMGQGIQTSLAQEIADELDVPYQKIRMVLGDTELCPWDGGTNGSRTTRSFGPAMREAAAEARAVLLQMASEKLKVPVSELVITEGIISSRSDKNKNISYSSLTLGKKIERHLSEKAVLKNYSEFNYAGKPFLKQEARQKVTGEAKYAADIKLPGMLHARILRPPSHGAKLISADTTEAEKIKGVIVIHDTDLIAVLSDDRDKADKAIEKIKGKYEFDEINVDEKTIFDRILKADSNVNVLKSSGEIEAGRQLSTSVTESEFHNSYVAHSPMEPHSAIARIDGNKITAWVGTQQPFPTQEDLARELKVPLENVRVITPYIGGGFGGKSAHRQAIEAAKLAKMTGKPVMVSWTRQEEFFYDTFRPAAVVRVMSGTDNTGKITFWDFHTHFAGSRGSDTIYDVPNSRTSDYSRGTSTVPVHPFATGAWRAPGNNTNTFARESQIDIMAQKAGMDPLDFRLKNLKDERMIAVLKAVADKFGYTPAKTPSGRGYGIACGTDVGTYVAHMAEVKVDKTTGHVQVLRVACAQDMGLCVNPEGTTIQMEGCITMGLGYALTEEIQFQGGNIKNHSFDSYELPRFSWVPKIETVILDKKDQPPQGGGEPAVICMGAVIANAVFDATGARFLQLPMTTERILEALKKV